MTTTMIAKAYVDNAEVSAGAQSLELQTWLEGYEMFDMDKPPQSMLPPKGARRMAIVRDGETVYTGKPFKDIFHYRVYGDGVQSITYRLFTSRWQWWKYRVQSMVDRILGG